MDVQTQVSTISGNTITLFVDHDANSQPISVNTEQSLSSAYHSAEDFRIEDNQYTRISLNGIIQKTLADHNSDIGRQMRKWLSEGEPVPKALIYTALKQALDNVDPTKPVLIVDRRLSFNCQASNPGEKLYPTSHIEQDYQSDSQSGMSNGIAVIGFPKYPCVLEQGNDQKESQQTSWPVRVLKFLKNALLPPDEPVPPPDPNEKQGDDKSNFLLRYFKKMRGGQKRPPYERPLEALQSLIVSFTGMLILTVIDFFVLTDTDYSLVIGSFGATAVLVFCAIKSPLAQPRNVMGGHLLAGIIGAAFQMLMGQKYPWLAAALAVSVSIAIMSLTNTVHPPAGATALIAVYSNDKIHKIGFMYVLVPVLAGAAILLLVAVLLNNLFPSRRYPVYWW